MAQQMQRPASELHIHGAHAAIMSSTFVVLTPLGAILVYLPISSKAIPYVHAQFQTFTACLAIAGLTFGVRFCSPDEYSEYHPIIGYVIVGLIVLAQPSLGLLQHLLFRRNGKKTILGNTHRRLGRATIILGMTNGGLAFRFAGPVGSDNVPKWSVVVYSVFAAVFGLSYTGFVIRQSSKTGTTDPTETKERSSYDSQRSINDRHYTGSSNGGHSNSLRGQGFTNAHIPTSSPERSVFGLMVSDLGHLLSRAQGGTALYPQEPLVLENLYR